MNTTPRSRATRRLILLCLVASALVITSVWLTMAFPKPAAADAGGWPTATPTATLFIPTATQPAYPLPSFFTSPEPTSPLMLFPPTPTFTPVVPAFAQELAVPEVQVQLATPRPSSARLSWVTCVPFAIVGLALAIAGAVALRSNIRQGIR